MALRNLIPVRSSRARRRQARREPSNRARQCISLELEALEERRLLAVVTFAQFLQRDTAAQNFAYSNQGGTSATFNQAPPAGNPVAVTFDQDLAHGLVGVQNAHLFLTSSTTEPAQLSGGELRERFPLPTNTLQILLDNPPDPARRNFLSVTYSDVLSGGDGSQAGNLRASDTTGDTVSYSSDWFDFRGSSAHSFALSFTSIISDDGLGLHRGAGDFYHSFTASGTGTFDTNFPVGAICGQKFNDLNGNGVRDPGEPGLPGWTMRLDEQDDPDPFQQLHVTTTTDATGNYCFPNLPAGLYRIREVNQAGWIQTTPDPDDITVRPDVTVRDVDFGNFRLVSVGGVKFHNHSGNGVRNPGDEGLAGWTIQLVDAAGTIRSTTTGADGSYTFDSVGPGTYMVQEVQQPGWVQTAPTPPGIYTVTTSSGSDVGGRDFGNFQLVTISGVKYNNHSGNGTRNPGDEGLSGWTIQLVDAAGTIRSATTGADGSYSFDAVGPGTYILQEVPQAGWVQTAPTPVPPGTYTVTTSGGSNVGGRDFGNFQLVTISGLKFHNHNGNGSRNPGDEGLSGWNIQLVDAAGTVRNATTGPDGSYSFTGVGPGTYIIQEVPQAGWVQTAPAAPDTYMVTASSGTNVGDRNFGNFRLVTISGLKFHNHSGNGSRNPGDEGLSGWTIQLVNAGGTIRSATTGADGSYSFTGVGPGSYTVQEVLQAGWTQTAPTPPGTYTVTTSSGTNVGGRDFGNFQLVTISGVKFHNHNGNGARNPGDEGLAGWMIQLLRSGVVVQATTTGANGGYSFTSVGPGTYTIQEVQQPGWVETAPNTGTYTVTVSSGQSVTGRDFGNFRTVAISGMKFNDLTGSGTFVPGDPRLLGWTIQLLSGTTVIATTTTDDSGNYSFTGIGPGTFSVQEVQQTDWLQTAPASGTYSVTTSSGINVGGRDFGNFHLVVISGQKFNDFDGSGRRDPSRPLAGWTIRLLRGSTEVASTTTDVHGEYVFRGIVPGTYTVAEQQQTGWIQTFPAAPGMYTFAVTSGQNVSARDFGNFHLVTISGQKFNDLNGNGIQDPGEPGLQGWVIHLRNTATGSDVNRTTDVNGNYSFTNVGPGNYVISEELQTGWVQTLPGGAGTYPVTANSGQDLVLKSFGNFHLVNISGRKFNDLTGRGVDDPGAPGLPNWTIRLVNSISGQEVTRTTTDSNGNYTLANVGPGSYTVAEVRQTGWKQTFPVNTGDYTFSVTSGQNVTSRNFGNFQLVSISGLKWNDLNGDGVRQPSEPLLPGWTIQLVNSSGVLVDSQVTNASGIYSFASVGPGTYTIREVQQPGWRQTAPAAPGVFTVTTTSGQNVTGREFGNIMTSSISESVGSAGELVPVFPSRGHQVEMPNAVGKVDLFANRPPGSGDMQAQAVYVSGLYQSLLNREPDINGLNHWVQVLQAGVSREEVARDVWLSAERRGIEVDHFYVTLLDRPADAGGRAFWVSALVNGATDVDVMRRILASDEYSAAHRTDSAFVTDLYVRALGRTPEQGGLDGWLRALQTGTTREAVAQAILTSAESDRRIIEHYYAVFLNRAADRGGEDSWLNALLSGRRTLESVGEAILASDEYFARLTRG